MKYYLTFLTLLYVSLGVSQDISGNVPTLSTSVFVINSASIHDKCDKANLATYSFFKEFNDNSTQYLSGAGVEEALVPMLVANADDFGISTTDRSYVFVRDRDSIKYTAFISKIANEASLNELIKSMIMREDEIRNGVGEGFEFAFNKKMVIAWNSRIVVFMDYSIPYSYNYSDYADETEAIEELMEETEDEYYESYADKLEAEENKKIELRRERILVALEEIYNPNPAHTIALNPRFQEATKVNSDVTIFFDGIQSLSGMDDLFGVKGNMENVLSIMSDNYFFGHFNINDSDIKAEFTYHISDSFKEQMRAANKAKFNKKFFKYIDGGNLIGYFGFAINPEPYYDMMMDIYSNVMSAIPDYGEVASGGLDIFNILLDEDEVFDFFQGDAFFAITDFKEFDVTYTSYDYDENFEEHEVITTKQELMPEYTFLSSIGNPELRNRILRLMEKSELLIPQEGYYTYRPPSIGYRRNKSSGLGGTHYVAIENDILIVTNNNELVTTHRVDGMPKDRRLAKEQRLHLKKNNYVGYWDAGKTFSKLDNEMKTLGKDFFKMMEVADKTFKSATLNGLENEGNLFKTTLTLNFVDQNKIAIVQLLEFVESMNIK